jgi:hypothetical protein
MATVRKIKKAQGGDFIGNPKAKRQMDANKNPTFSPSFTDKRGVTKTFETDTTGYASGRRAFPYRETVSGTSEKAENLKKKAPNPNYGFVGREAVAKELSAQGGKQKNGGKMTKAKGGKWIQKAIKKPGALRAQLGAKPGQPIPAGKLSAAAKKPGKLGQRARLAQTLKKMKKK